MDVAPYDRLVETVRPILVVDDDLKIVRLVRTYLEREGFRVVEAHDGREALAAIVLETPALVVLDLMLPHVDGLSIIRAVRRHDDVPIVMISARGTTADRIEGLSEGADDYLAKPFSPAELVVRVKRVLARAVRVDAQLALPPLQHADLVVDRDAHETSLGGHAVPLTPLEFRLLTALLEANGRVLTRDQLLDAVYRDADADVLDRTIDALVKRLREKLRDDAERPRYIATVRGVGYRLARSAASGT